MIVLFYGQPASGKTTLADEFIRSVHPPEGSVSFFRIDGDDWRRMTGNKDYSKEGRERNLISAFSVAKYMEMMHYTPVLSFVTPLLLPRLFLAEQTNLMQVYLEYEGNRGRNANFSPFFERPQGEYLHLDTSKYGIVTCMKKILIYYHDFVKSVKDGTNQATHSENDYLSIFK
jgi:hypothetical protein